MAKFNPGDFIVPKAKPLPVILLIDTSGSMGEVIDTTGMQDTGRVVYSDGKQYHVVTGGISRMMVLNQCCRQMIEAFVDNVQNEVDIEVAIITFGSTVQTVQPLAPAASIQWQELHSDGETPLGAALVTAKNLIEDRNVIPSRSYRPVVILVSDGRPDAGWEGPFQQFIGEGRSAKCDRMAMGIGDDADKDILSRFIAGTGHPLFSASDPEKIKEFFRYATMSVTVRSVSKDPNKTPQSVSGGPDQPSVGDKGTSTESTSLDDDDDLFF